MPALARASSSGRVRPWLRMPLSVTSSTRLTFFPRQQLGHALHALQQFWLPVGQKGQRDAEHQLERAAVQFADRIHIHTSRRGMRRC